MSLRNRLPLHNSYAITLKLHPLGFYSWTLWISFILWCGNMFFLFLDWGRLHSISKCPWGRKRIWTSTHNSFYTTNVLKSSIIHGLFIPLMFHFPAGVGEKKPLSSHSAATVWRLLDWGNHSWAERLWRGRAAPASVPEQSHQVGM